MTSLAISSSSARRAGVALNLLRAGGPGDVLAESISPTRPMHGAPGAIASDTIRAIVENAASRARSAAAETIASFGKAAAALDTSSEILFEVDGRKISASDVASLGDDLVAGTADWLAEYGARRADAKEWVVGRIADLETRTDLNGQNEAMLAAYRNGSLEVVSFEEMGVASSTTYHIVSGDAGTSRYASHEHDGLAAFRTERMALQDDGSYIDTVTGKYVAYGISNGAGYFLFADPAPSRQAA